MQYYLNVWKNYANFEGRARRSEYWYFHLFNTIIVFGLSFLMVLVSEDLAIFYYLYVLLAILPGWAVGVRRMHDVGKSGWYLIIPIYSLILCLTEGDRGANLYGRDPKQVDLEEMEGVL